MVRRQIKWDILTNHLGLINKDYTYKAPSRRWQWSTLSTADTWYRPLSSWQTEIRQKSGHMWPAGTCRNPSPRGWRRRRRFKRWRGRRTVGADVAKDREEGGGSWRHASRAGGVAHMFATWPITASRNTWYSPSSPQLAPNKRCKRTVMLWPKMIFHIIQNTTVLPTIKSNSLSLDRLWYTRPQSKYDV